MSLETTYNLSHEDWEFVKKLTKVAHVHVLSQQVSLKINKTNCFSTSEQNRLTFPSNWGLEYVHIEPSKYEDRHVVSMTWKIFKPKK